MKTDFMQLGHVSFTNTDIFGFELLSKPRCIHPGNISLIFLNNLHRPNVQLGTLSEPDILSNRCQFQDKCKGAADQTWHLLSGIQCLFYKLHDLSSHIHEIIFCCFKFKECCVCLC